MSKLSNVLKVTLLSSSILISNPLLAQNQNNLEDRVKNLETLMEKILTRLEQQEARLEAGEIEILQETRRIVSEQQTALATQEKRVAEIANNGGDASASNGFKIGDTTFTFGGYAKLDAIYTKFSDGELASGASGRDFFVPGQIPVVAGGSDDGGDIDFGARETRFIMKTMTPTSLGKIGGHLEMDFNITGGGNEVVSNSYSPRLRQAFLTYRGWTFGQAWSTFQNTKVWLDHIDFLGAIGGMVFNRQALVRYQSGPFEIAAETPETILTALGGAKAVSGDGMLPDIVARYTNQGDWGHIRLAGILRELKAEAGTAGLTNSASELGYGLSLSGKLNTFDKDQFSFLITAGEGIGRYIALNLTNDVAVTPTGELKTIGVISGFASYKHYWSSKWRSNLTLGYFKADNPTTFTGTAVTDSSMSLHANILYSPIKKLTLGVEYIYGNRELESNLKGSMNRMQFSAKLGF